MKNAGKYVQEDYEGGREDHCVGVLPPGIDKFQKETHGEFRLSVGDLGWLNSATNFDHILVKPVFWGDNNSKWMLRAKNTSMDQVGVVHHEARYEVR